MLPRQRSHAVTLLRLLVVVLKCHHSGVLASFHSLGNLFVREEEPSISPRPNQQRTTRQPSRLVSQGPIQAASSATPSRTAAASVLSLPHHTGRTHKEMVQAALRPQAQTAAISPSVELVESVTSPPPSPFMVPAHMNLIGTTESPTTLPTRASLARTGAPPISQMQQPPPVSASSILLRGATTQTNNKVPNGTASGKSTSIDSWNASVVSTLLAAQDETDDDAVVCTTENCASASLVVAATGSHQKRGKGSGGKEQMRIGDGKGGDTGGGKGGAGGMGHMGKGVGEGTKGKGHGGGGKGQTEESGSGGMGMHGKGGTMGKGKGKTPFPTLSPSPGSDSPSPSLAETSTILPTSEGCTFSPTAAKVGKGKGGSGGMGMHGKGGGMTGGMKRKTPSPSPGSDSPSPSLADTSTILPTSEGSISTSSPTAFTTELPTTDTVTNEPASQETISPTSQPSSTTIVSKQPTRRPRSVPIRAPVVSTPIVATPTAPVPIVSTPNAPIPSVATPILAPTRVPTPIAFTGAPQPSLLPSVNQPIVVTGVPQPSLLPTVNPPIAPTAMSPPSPTVTTLTPARSIVPSLGGPSFLPALPTGTPVRTLLPSVAPLPSPLSLTPVTPAPISNIPTTPVPATPFSLQFDGAASSTTPADYEAVQSIVLDYLNGFLVDNFALSLEFQYASLDGRLQSSAIGPSPGSWLTSYNLDGLFTSTQLPSTPELDVLIAVAFAMPFVAELLASLQAAPSTSAFSGITSVTYTSPI